MNFNEFVSEVKDNIKLFLPEEYENVEVSTTAWRNNGNCMQKDCRYSY